MKAVIIFALVFVALASAQGDIAKPTVCKPGATKMMECNHCFCITDGSGWACTEMGCSIGTYGPNSDSSAMGTEPANLPERVSRETKLVDDNSEDDVSIGNLRVCEPGTTKRVECNTCFCTRDGSGWGCTRKGCYQATIVVADSDKIPKQTGSPTQ